MRSLVLLALLLSPVSFASGASREINAANVLAEMNHYRAAEGLPPLHEDPRLTRAAQDRMRHMEELGYWSHAAPDGMSPFVWLAARDYPYSAAGENLANGFDTVAVLVEAWIESPGHRANILAANYEDVGIAFIEGSTTGPANGMSVVVLFGAARRVKTAAK